MTALIKFKSWMGKVPHLSTKNINNTEESIWNWKVISNVAPIQVIRNLPDKPWDYQVVSRRKDFDIEMVKEYPDKDWDFEYLSKNPAITIDIILATKDKPWNMTDVSRGTSEITFDIAFQHKDIKWDWKAVSEFVFFHQAKANMDCDWDWSKISAYQNHYSIQDVLENPDIPWDWYYVSMHPELTWEIIDNNRNLPWDWTVLSAHPIVTFHDIMTKNKPWSWWEFGMNPNLTADIIRANPLKPWCFKSISHNYNLVNNDKGNILLDFPNEDWDWDYVSAYCPYTFIAEYYNTLPLTTEGILSGNGIDWEFVNEMATKMEWDWVSVVNHNDLTTEAAIMLLPHYVHNNAALDALFEHRRCDIDVLAVVAGMGRYGRVMSWDGAEELCCWTWNHVLTYPNEDWNWRSLSISKKVTMDIIEKHMDLPWDWEWVSDNPNLTWQFILAHPTLEWDVYADEYRRAMKEKNEYDLERARIMSRNETVKEGVIAGALHPTRFQKYLESYNYDMAGDEYI